MVAAYQAVESGQKRLTELQLLRAIEVFGVRAVMGRDQLYGREIQGMMLANRVVMAYLARKKYKDWTEFTKDHPTEAELLAGIEKMIDEAQ